MATKRPVLIAKPQVDDLILANEQVEYYSERAAKLEAELEVAQEIIKRWWGGIYIHPIARQLQADSEQFLINIAKADLL